MLLLGAAQGTLARQPDEDVAAHLFQILIPLQIVLIGAFAGSWLPKQPRSAVRILCLQGAGLLLLLIDRLSQTALTHPDLQFIACLMNASAASLQGRLKSVGQCV